MANEVYANMMEVSCKAASGKTICAFPDVCFTPPQTPATPPGVPIPYPNTGMASDTTDGSTSVKISGKEVMLKNKSCFSKSTGDEAGVAPKKGVITSKNMGKVFFNMWSMDVKVEGENVVRHLDITTHNHASMPGNTPPMPHTDAMAMAADPGTAECAVCAQTGSPVDPVLGVKVLAGDEDLDFVVPGPLALEWQRSYLSSNLLVGWCGPGWRTPLELSIEPSPDGGIDYRDEFGRLTRFVPTPRNASSRSRFGRLTLSRSEDGDYCVTTADGLGHHFIDAGPDGHRLARITDRNDNAIAIEWVSPQTLYVHCSGGQLLELGFDARQRLIEVTELRGVAAGDEDRRRVAGATGAVQRVSLAGYHYDGNGNLAGVVDRSGERVREFNWQSQLMVRQVFAGSFEAFYEYAGDGAEARVVRHWDNIGRSWTFGYEADRTVVTDQDGGTEIYHFDARQHWTGYTDQLGNFTQRGLDRFGNLRVIVDPAGHVTETEYDDRSNPVATCDAAGSVTQTEWHPKLPLPLQTIDPLGRTTKYEYDPRGNLIRETDPAGAETSYRYDERGLISAIEDANGGTSRFSHDARGQIESFTDCTGARTAFAHDDNGFLIATTDALGRHTEYDCDARGLKRRERRPDGSSESYDYDAAGRLASVTNGQGACTRYRYTPDGLLAQKIDALGGTLSYRYDAGRRLVALQNENGATHTFGYDAVGRLIEERRFDGTCVIYAHDLAGRIVERIEGRNPSSRVVTHYRHDPMGRVLERRSGETQSSFTYDPAGQLRSASNARSKVLLDYDAAGRVVAEATETDRGRHVIRRAFDALGNCLATTLPDGRIIQRLYYGSGHAHQVNLDGRVVCDIERNVVHQEVARTLGALTMTRRYDAGGRLLRQGPAASLHSTASEPSRLDRQYSRDNTGRLQKTSDRAGSSRYGYDALDRLTRFNDGRFAFDPAHNLVGTGETADRMLLNNRLDGLGDVRYLHDEHGRVVEKRTGSSVRVRLRWDDEHRLVHSTTEQGSVVNEVHYLYDAFGRRLAKGSRAAGFTWFTWDGDALLQEVSTRGVVHTILYEPDGFVPLAQDVKVMERDSTIYHYHCDQIGLPREMTNPAGAVVWEGDFGAWGKAEQLRFHLETAAGDAPIQPLRFQGQYEDAETGLHYNRHRYYDPDSGVYLTQDPIGLEGGVNTYRYPGNPFSFADPLGLMPSVGNVADTQIVQDYGEYRSNEISQGKTPDDNCTWLGKNKGKYRPDQVKPTEKAWGCKGSRHCKGGKKR